MTDIPTVEELEALFQEGKMECLGDGSRRVCYALPGGKFCVKSYRSEEELETHMRPDGSLVKHTLKSSVIKEIRKARFDEKLNTSCQEYRYWKQLKERLPADVFSIFPQTMECVLVPSRGWCVIEERIENFDGSKPSDFAQEFRAAGCMMKGRLLESLNELVSGLVEYAVRFYDPQNLVLQKIRDGGFRLRLVDFEPATRSFIPVDSMFPSCVRRKTLRRVDRWLREQMGVLNRRESVIALMRGPVSVSFSVSDSYSQHLAVVLASILENNPASRFKFHVLHRDMSEENRSRIGELEKNNLHCKIEFHRIDASVFEKFPIPKELEHVTQEMYYRYILPDVLADEDRTVYSDVDVLCVGDLRPLWETDLKGNIIAAVSEGERGEFKKKLIGLAGDAPYFYSGLLVMDLAAMRAEGCSRKLMENTAAYAGRIAWPDQDMINLTFRGRILQLGPEWDGINVKYSPFRKGVVIWHFPGITQKPWCNIWKNMTWPIYLGYLRKSPYRGEALRFVMGHVKGFFYFRYTKNRVKRHLVCGIRVWRTKESEK